MNDYFYEREKLYSEVWTEPTTTVAKKYGVSDVAIHKACKRLEIPVPPRGYWAKVAAGKRVRRQPLPPTDGPTTLRRHYQSDQSPSSLPKKESKAQTEALTLLDEQERERVLSVCSSLRVKEKLLKPHPLVKQDQETRAARKRQEREESHLPPWGRRDYDFWSESAGKLLDITAQPEELTRIYRILSAVFEGVEAIGGTLQLDNANRHTLVHLMGERIRIRLKSRGDALSFTIEEYVSGPRKNWSDGKRKELEGDVGSIVLGLLECAHALRVVREQRKREEDERHLAAIKRMERERAERAEQERFQVLEKAAADWQKARMIEGYIAALEAQAQSETDEARRIRLLDYIVWAKGKILWLDPLTAHEDPILGTRR